MNTLDLIIEQREQAEKQVRESAAEISKLQAALIKREAIIIMAGDPVGIPKRSCYALAVERLKLLGFLPDWYEFEY